MSKGGEQQDNEGSNNEQNRVCSWSLPEEIYLNIFSRLHIRYLIRCRCVCKFWHTLISDPYLVSMHLTHPQGKEPDLILVVNEYEKDDESGNYRTRKNLYTVENIGCNDEAVKPLPLPPIDLNPFAFCIKASFDGLIWLTNSWTPSSKSFYVWNPCTGEILRLPSPRTMMSKTSIFFGFDHNSSLNDYTLFGLFSNTNGSDNNLEAEVWTLGSGSWRRIGKVPFAPKFSTDCVSTVGALHWLSEDINPHSVYVGVCSFVIGNNKEFQFTPLPRKITCGNRYSIGSLWGCLSAVDYSFPRHIQIWILKQLGVKESWTKQYVMSIDEEDIFQLRLLCLLKCGKILLQYNGMKLVSYNPKSRKIREIGLHRFLGNRNLDFDAFLHIGTLLSPMPCNRIVYES
ncbi:hypothetical protein IFM89_039075 [Coptis chinensis]|uniref:F-box domain-containing protein n=1 Tax=Coptis chinensis TaxID=261450 RepID=A0A835I9T5_9MAGN|nr:hypothetical protein IFM89_039075 [Coptis chinensis]